MTIAYYDNFSYPIDPTPILGIPPGGVSGGACNTTSPIGTSHTNNGPPCAFGPYPGQNKPVNALLFYGYATGPVQLGLYQDDGSGNKPGTLLGITAAATSYGSGYASWLEAPILDPSTLLPKTITLAAGTNYWIACVANSGLTYMYYTATGTASYQFRYKASGTTLPASGSWGSDTLLGTYPLISVQAIYSALPVTPVTYNSVLQNNAYWSLSAPSRQGTLQFTICYPGDTRTLVQNAYGDYSYALQIGCSNNYSLAGVFPGTDATHPSLLDPTTIASGGPLVFKLTLRLSDLQNNLWIGLAESTPLLYLANNGLNGSTYPTGWMVRLRSNSLVSSDGTFGLLSVSVFDTSLAVPQGGGIFNLPFSEQSLLSDAPQLLDISLVVRGVLPNGNYQTEMWIRSTAGGNIRSNDWLCAYAGECAFAGPVGPVIRSVGTSVLPYCYTVIQEMLWGQDSTLFGGQVEPPYDPASLSRDKVVSLNESRYNALSGTTYNQDVNCYPAGSAVTSVGMLDMAQANMTEGAPDSVAWLWKANDDLGTAWSKSTTVSSGGLTGAIFGPQKAPGLTITYSGGGTPTIKILTDANNQRWLHLYVGGVEQGFAGFTYVGPYGSRTVPAYPSGGLPLADSGSGAFPTNPNNFSNSVLCLDYIKQAIGTVANFSAAYTAGVFTTTYQSNTVYPNAGDVVEIPAAASFTANSYVLPVEQPPLDPIMAQSSQYPQRLLAVTYRVYTSGQQVGTIVFRFSSDGGATWSAEALVASTISTTSAMSAIWSTAQQCWIICAYGASNETYLFRSTGTNAATPTVLADWAAVQVVPLYLTEPYICEIADGSAHGVLFISARQNIPAAPAQYTYSLDGGATWAAIQTLDGTFSGGSQTQSLVISGNAPVTCFYAYGYLWLLAPDLQSGYYGVSRAAMMFYRSTIPVTATSIVSGIRFAPWKQASLQIPMQSQSIAYAYPLVHGRALLVAYGRDFVRMFYDPDFFDSDLINTGATDPGTTNVLSGVTYLGASGTETGSLQQNVTNNVTTYSLAKTDVVQGAQPQKWIGPFWTSAGVVLSGLAPTLTVTLPGTTTPIPATGTIGNGGVTNSEGKVPYTFAASETATPGELTMTGYVSGSLEWSANYQVGTINGAHNINVVVASPIAQNLMLTLVHGDAYDGTTNQAITFSDGGTWPTMTNGVSQLGTVEVKLTISSQTGSAVVTSSTGVVSGSSPNQTIAIPITAAQTTLLTPGIPYVYDLRASINYPTNTEIRTLVSASRVQVNAPVTVSW